jgi:hypothetical protein
MPPDEMAMVKFPGDACPLHALDGKLVGFEAIVVVDARQPARSVTAASVPVRNARRTNGRPDPRESDRPSNTCCC